MRYSLAPDFFPCFRSSGSKGTGTCEEIDPRDLSGDPKCIQTLQSSFISALNDKFLSADSVEMANLHFFTRSRREVSPYSSHIHGNHSAPLIAVQPSFSTIRCKTLNIFTKVCYSLPCLSNAIPANLFPISVSQSLPPPT